MHQNPDSGTIPSPETNAASAAQKPHVLVLGGGGFIGRAVVADLLGRGCRVTGLVRNTPLPEGAVSVRGDIRDFDWRQLEADLPDAIVHLARIPGRRRLSRWWAGRQGKRASERLLRWLESLDRPPHSVYVSGTLVYGDRGTLPTDESAPLHPIAFQRDYVKAELPFLEALGRLPVSVVRPPWVIGPGSWFQQFYVQAVRYSGKLTQFGAGQNLMSLIQVQDCAAQISAVALGGEAVRGRIFNTCAVPAITHEAFVRLSAEVLGCGITKVSESELRRKYGQTVYEALTFSMDVRSREALIRDFPNRFATAEAAIRASL